MGNLDFCQFYIMVIIADKNDPRFPTISAILDHFYLLAFIEQQVPSKVLSHHPVSFNQSCSISSLIKRIILVNPKHKTSNIMITDVMTPSSALPFPVPPVALPSAAFHINFGKPRQILIVSRVILFLQFVLDP